MTIDPMKTNLGPILDRVYRETSRFQWARETAVNAIEAGATRIEFTAEQQGVTSHNVYRRLIADDGRGMSADELEEFFNVFGGGGKPIGSEHENFGTGAKTTLLPWNKLGVVVVSWQDGIANMIRIRQRTADGEYGLERFAVEGDGGSDTVVEPFYDAEFGIDWSQVKPDWITDHGTVIVLLGNSADQDTMRGDPDPERNEEGVRVLTQYLNLRFWKPGTRINVLEFTTNDKNNWPTEFWNNRGGFNEGFMRRPAQGAAHFVADRATYSGRQMQLGTIDVGEASIDWYLWEPSNLASSHDNRFARSGFSCVLYKNELYNRDEGLTALRRSFGICEKVVSDNLWLVIRAPEHSLLQKGVYPRADRSSLLWSGGRELPMEKWAEEFADHLPAPIVEALKRARKETSSSLEDRSWLGRLAQRFAFRLRIERLRPAEDGQTMADEATIDLTKQDSEQTTRSVPNRPSRPRPRRVVDQPKYSLPGKEQNATKTTLKLGLPNCVFTNDPVDADQNVAVTWTKPNKSTEPSGLISIWRYHPAMESIVHSFQKDYRDHQAEHVRDIVQQVYKETMVCRVAHSQEMVKFVGKKVVEDDMRSGISLTMSLLGMRAEDALIRQRLAATIGRRHRRPSDQMPQAPIEIVATTPTQGTA